MKFNITTAIVTIVGFVAVGFGVQALKDSMEPKVLIMPPGDGGSETLESFDPSKGSGRVVWPDAPASMEDVQALSGKVTGNIYPTIGQMPVRQKDGSIIWESPPEETATADTPPKLGPNERTYTAPDGVNTITENADGTGSMTLVWVPKPAEQLLATGKGVPAMESLEDAAKRQQKHVITQADAEEVMVIIRDSLNAHHFALEFYETALKTMNEPADHAKVRDNIDRVIANSRRLIEFEAKWRKRVEEGKP